MPDHDATRRLLRGCDPAQQEAITIDHSPVLVLAGAGSGKTRVLTNRIAWRALQKSASPSHVLALTFTRKAASELRQRLTRLGLSEQVTAGTFHAIALAELRRHAADEGKSMPAVLDSKARLLQGVIPEGHEPGTARFTRTELLRIVAGEIEWARARLVAPRDYGFAATNARRNLSIDARLITTWYEAYEREKKRRHLYDFDDLLEQLALLMETNANFAAVEHWRFRHLFVDELQDANPAQLRLLSAWHGPGCDLFAVGDARQAIYGWNGSDPTAVTQFATRFAGARVLELATNYRSTPQVVAFASSVLDGDALCSGPVRDDGPLPTITSYESDEDEVFATLEQIRHYRRRGRAWSEMAVLARTNAQLRLFEQAFGKGGVPTRGTVRWSARSSVLQDLARARDHTMFVSRLQDLEDLLEGDGASDVLHEPGARAEHLVLARLAREYVALDAAASGEGFLAYLRSDVVESDEDAVSLFSFHRAKGLEWKVVFVVGLEEGLVPIAHARTAAAKEEERRLLYVALSRAEDVLHCSYAEQRHFAGRRQTRSPSPYIERLTEALGHLPRPVLPSSNVVERAIAASRAALEQGSENP